MEETAQEKARILVAEIQEALARGTKHYDKAGRLLDTPQTILDTLLHEGVVQLKRPHDWQFYMNGTFCRRCGVALALGDPTDCSPWNTDQ